MDGGGLLWGASGNCIQPCLSVLIGPVGFGTVISMGDENAKIGIGNDNNQLDSRELANSSAPAREEKHFGHVLFASN